MAWVWGWGESTVHTIAPRLWASDLDDSFEAANQTRSMQLVHAFVRPERENHVRSQRHFGILRYFGELRRGRLWFVALDDCGIGVCFDADLYEQS